MQGGRLEGERLELAGRLRTWARVRARVRVRVGVGVGVRARVGVEVKVRVVVVVVVRVRVRAHPGARVLRFPPLPRPAAPSARRAAR